MSAFLDKIRFKMDSSSFKFRKDKKRKKKRKKGEEEGEEEEEKWLL